MPEFRWREAGEVIEHYLPKCGRPLIRASMVCGALFVIGAGLWWFFGKFVGEVFWPFLVKIFGGEETGITLDNIEAIIIVLVATICMFVIIFIVFAIGILRIFRRRIVPQQAIDCLAELRSEGISILNDLPEDPQNMTSQQKDDFVEEWQKSWKKWADKVIEFLRKNFTSAERSSFQRLGLLTEHRFSIAVTPRHAHSLMLLAKQLTTLENLIDRYQERL